MIAPTNRLQALTDGLMSAGYPLTTMERDYEFSARNGTVSLFRADLVAFGEGTRRDLETTCIVGQLLDSESDAVHVLEPLRVLAAPIAVTLGPDAASVWPMAPELPAAPLEQIAYSDLGRYLADRQDRYSPPAVMRLKRPLQTSLFTSAEGDLIDYARQVTREILTEQYSDALGAVVDNTTKSNKASLIRYSVRALAAAALEDRRYFGGGRSPSAKDLLLRASQLGSFFTLRDYDRVGTDVAEEFLFRLREGVTLRAFSTEDLGHFYEFALTDDQTRRAAGIYYTPRGIAQRMAETLPIETMHPTSRTVFDGTCGSGSLLLAARRRLVDSLPSSMPPADQHTYLVDHIAGLDRDGFAAEVAKTALFLADLPAGNGWKVQTDDLLRRDFGDIRYGIILANPPFLFDRGRAQRSQQTANLMLERYIELLHDDGLLAVVMPESFTTSTSSTTARRRLLDTCDVQELWRLPERVFSASSAATVVVFAQKRRAGRQGLARVVTVSPTAQVRRSFVDGRATGLRFVQRTSDWLSDPGRRLITSGVSPILSNLRYTKRLGDVALVKNGIQAYGRGRFHADPGDEGVRPWLDGAGRIRPFHIHWPTGERNYVEWPGDLWRPRKDLLPWLEQASAKVLINANRNTSNPWRLSAAVDRIGLFPAQGVHLICPTDDSISVNELAAILNSSIANAWLDGRTRMQWINQDALRELPLPELTSSSRARLSRLTSVAEDTAIDNPQFSHILAELDAVVGGAYGLESSEIEQLSRLFPRGSRPEAMVDTTPDPDTDHRATPPWPVTGHVLSVNEATGTMRLWVRAVTDDEGVTVSPPDGMPGWAMHDGADFEALSSRGRTANASDIVASLHTWRPIEFAYLSESELDALLANPHAAAVLFGAGSQSA